MGLDTRSFNYLVEQFFFSAISVQSTAALLLCVLDFGLCVCPVVILDESYIYLLYAPQDL
jgi:hypothetical protein